MYKDFDDLPFKERPDISPYLIHLTKNTIKDDDYSAFDNLVSILKNGCIWGSGNEGYVKGKNKATCFMDIPFISLKYIINEENSDPDNPRYEPYGIFINKKFAYRKGCRPVLYLSNKEVIALKIPDDELWRVVRFEVVNGKWISWIHEREWRYNGEEFKLPLRVGILIKTPNEARKLQNMINNNPKDFKITPTTILPLTIVCQGLLI